MSTKFSVFDPAEYLNSDEAIAAYINEVTENGDDDLFLSAMADVVRAKGEGAKSATGIALKRAD
jgi:probable addiction module antidote protein